MMTEKSTVRSVADKRRIKSVMQIGEASRFSLNIHLAHECDPHHFKLARSASIIRRVKPSLPDGEGFLLDWFLRDAQH
jgi:hypothetical protein